jgi:adenylylsulfate reductase subunit A
MSNQEQTIVTDLLVVGGGIAGLNAALSAVEKNASVTVMDKAVIERSGHTAGGIDHFGAFLNTGPEWDTREAYLDYTVQYSRGATRPEVVDRVYCDNLPQAMKRFEKIGVPLHRADGSYYRTRSYGQPGPWWINFNGKRLKPSFASAVRKAGCTVLDRVVTADLLVNDGRVCGAVGFHIRSGECVVVKAKAVIVSTGGTNRLFTNPTGLSFNTWMCPANTGDGEAVSFRAGASLANIEFLRMTVVPNGFGAPGLNALVGMGGILINGMGEAFMSRYHPDGMNSPRYKLVEAVITELKARRGPVYIDCRHLDPKALAHLVETLSFDKDTFGDFLAQKGVDLRQDLLEVAPSEGMQGGPNEVCGSGIRIDENCAATVPGLFAAGNCSDQNRSLHMAATSGLYAGYRAFEFAQRNGAAPEPPKGLVSDIKHRIYAPTKGQGRTSWQAFEDSLQRIITESLGPTRSAWGFKLAAGRLERLAGWMDTVKCPTFHDLCRFQELYNIMTVAKCMLAAASFRTESRFDLCHHRIDFPEQDDENWQGQIVVRKGDGDVPDCRFNPLTYDAARGGA